MLSKRRLKILVSAASLLCLNGCLHLAGEGVVQEGIEADEHASYRVSKVADLEALELRAANRDAAQWIDRLREGIAARERVSQFFLGFRHYRPEPPLVDVFDREGRAIEIVIEAAGGEREPQQRDEPESCIHALPPTLAAIETFLHPERYRGMQCGNIATIHSLVKLGVLTEEQAFNGNYLDRDRVRGLNHAHHFETQNVGMTSREVQDAHKLYATADKPVECSYPLSSRIADPNVERVLNTAGLVFNSPAETMDCSLEVRGDFDANGRPRIAHIEQITGMRGLGNGHWEIDTVNGFEQGETDATIPKAPGSNTWEFGGRTGRLKRASRGVKDVMKQLVYEEFSVICCYVPRAGDQ
ncbi:MAG: hypothetical protein H6956_01145 [Chromatiaceae bacterium]|nr:hypothetical protein [Gammaproteobacteria bacterium]MCP5316514.1 hypothetical protein [Chromatiaceae bacterium]MCP5434179.1 hypothetical protein [Chromatiaceae bacterium]